MVPRASPARGYVTRGQGEDVRWERASCSKDPTKVCGRPSWSPMASSAARVDARSSGRRCLGSSCGASTKRRSTRGWCAPGLPSSTRGLGSRPLLEAKKRPVRDPEFAVGGASSVWVPVQRWVLSRRSFLPCTICDGRGCTPYSRSPRVLRACRRGQRSVRHTRVGVCGRVRASTPSIGLRDACPRRIAAKPGAAWAAKMGSCGSRRPCLVGTPVSAPRARRIRPVRGATTARYPPPYRAPGPRRGRSPRAVRRGRSGRGCAAPRR